METLWTLVAIMVLIHFLQGWVRDNSDGPKGSKKYSGVFVRTDYGTGNQYLETVFGSITPRLDANGKPVNIKTNPIRDSE